MALDAADLEQIGKLIAETQKKQAEESAKAQAATIAAALKTQAAETAKALEAMKAETAASLAAISKPADPPVDPKKGTPPDESPALKKLQADLDAMRKTAEASARRAEEAEQKRSAELLTSGTRDALLAAGVDPKRVHLALPVLQSSGRVKLDDKGAPTFVFQRNGYEESLPIADGAKEWVGTDDGKLYMPPVGTQGTGGGLGGSGAKSGGPTTNPLDIVLGALSGL